MQYNGLDGGQYVAPVVSRHMKQYNLGGARAASYSNHSDMASSRGSAAGWRSASAAQPGHHGVFVPNGQTKSSVSPIPFHRNDVVARHLLVETALLDSQDYELLPIEEVDALKKEKAQLDARLEATRRKLALESKVKDAAQSLHRLYSNKERPTPPLSPKKRISFLGEKGRTASGSERPKSTNANQADNELLVSQRKMDDLLQILSGLESRRQYVESRLLRHTAAVLQVAHQDEAEAKANSVHMGTPSTFDDSDRTFTNNTHHDFGKGSLYEESIYSNEYFEGGAKDLGITRLNGSSLNVRKRSPLGEFGQSNPQDDEKMGALQGRLESLNLQMRSLIKEARSGRSTEHALAPEDIPVVVPSSEDTVARLDNQAEILDNSIAVLEQELANLKDIHEVSLDDAKHLHTEVEEQLEGINNQIYILLTASRTSESVHELDPPPGITGETSQVQLNYLEESMLVLGDVLQQSGNSERASREIMDAHANASEHAEKLSQHETTLHGLWDVINSEDEPYSLQAFNTRVQHMHDRSSQHEVQMDILRRQIQQQRELNSKSDGEKDQEFADLQASHAEKEAELAELQERHVLVQNEVESSRSEMENVMSEMESLRQTHESNVEHKQQLVNELNEHRQRVAEHEATVADYETHITELREQTSELQEHQERAETLTKELTDAHAAREDAQTQLENKHTEMANLEGEVVRLTTELTMARAELDGAYGSRAERAKDLTSAEIDQLKKEREDHTSKLQELKERHTTAEERSAALEQELATVRAENQAGGGADSRTAMMEKELREMSNEFEELTKETVEAEKDRSLLEAQVDRLREKCEELEALLSDEKVRWLGIKSPTTVNGDPGRETTSTAVLRSEFKKMMRETRTEGVRLLRAEQEERRKLEALVRTMKRDKTSRISPRPSETHLRTV